MAPSGHYKDELQPFHENFEAKAGQEEAVPEQHQLQHNFVKNVKARKVYLCSICFIFDSHGAVWASTVGGRAHDCALLLILTMASDLAALERVSLLFLGVP